MSLFKVRMLLGKQHTFQFGRRTHLPFGRFCAKAVQSRLVPFASSNNTTHCCNVKGVTRVPYVHFKLLQATSPLLPFRPLRLPQVHSRRTREGLDKQRPDRHQTAKRYAIPNVGSTLHVGEGCPFIGSPKWWQAFLIHPANCPSS